MAITRMQFLRGDFSGKSAPLRPPWALDETLFVDTCDGCGRCIKACPTQILKAGRAGFPEVDFSSGECLFCGDCVSSCRLGALVTGKVPSPWSIKIVLDTDTCLAHRGVACSNCIDPCEPRAIRQRYQPGGVALPEVDLSLCSGCGACYGVCPVRAISLEQVQTEELA